MPKLLHCERETPARCAAAYRTVLYCTAHLCGTSSSLSFSLSPASYMTVCLPLVGWKATIVPR